jgi:hypothetical protein
LRSRGIDDAELQLLRHRLVRPTGVVRTPHWCSRSQGGSATGASLADHRHRTWCARELDQAAPRAEGRHPDASTADVRRGGWLHLRRCCLGEVKVGTIWGPHECSPTEPTCASTHGWLNRWSCLTYRNAYSGELGVKGSQVKSCRPDGTNGRFSSHEADRPFRV